MSLRGPGACFCSTILTSQNPGSARGNAREGIVCVSASESTLSSEFVSDDNHAELAWFATLTFFRIYVLPLQYFTIMSPCKRENAQHFLLSERQTR